MAEADLSKIVNIIMENPSLVEEIRSLAAKDTSGETEGTREVSQEEVGEAAPAPPTYDKGDGRAARQRRATLLSALKPYISPERGKAIETMIGLADALDLMKG